MPIPFFLADAFAEGTFRGNPAAVCPLSGWPDDALLQDMAAEHNQSETAFYVPFGDGYELRWFTPAMEVDLCGHATLAAAYVLWLTEDISPVRFYTKSGVLTVRRDGARFVLDFPARPAAPIPMDDALALALGRRPKALYRSERDVLVLYDAEQEVAALRPDFRALYNITGEPRLTGYIATAPGTDCHFVSRFFAPNAGIDEDPVTGSAHSVLVPFWAERLGESELTARQLSRRGGVLHCRDRGARVDIGGNVWLYARGEIVQLTDNG